MESGRKSRLIRSIINGFRPCVKARRKNISKIATPSLNTIYMNRHKKNRWTDRQAQIKSKNDSESNDKIMYPSTLKLSGFYVCSRKLNFKFTITHKRCRV